MIKNTTQDFNKILFYYGDDTNANIYDNNDVDDRDDNNNHNNNHVCKTTK